MIQRAATNGEIETLERLLAWQDKQIADAKQTAFKEALAAAQSRMKAIGVDSENRETHSRYASLAALDEAVRDIYTSHGFSLTFDTEDTTLPEVVRVVCNVSHEDGHSRQFHINMPADGKGPKGGAVMSRTHATGSAITYGRRYLLCMIFNLTVTQDDDGNAAGRRQAQRQGRAAPVAQQRTPTWEDLMAQEFPSPHRQASQPRRGPMSYAAALKEARIFSELADEEIADVARIAAREGRAAINEFCLHLTKPQYETLRPLFPELEALVNKAEGVQQ
jgi:hypothetical protein